MDHIAFLVDRGMTFLGPIWSSKEFRVSTLEKDMGGKEVSPSMLKICKYKF